MEILIIGLLIANILLHVVYDFWSTWKIKKGPDGKIGTEDDGIEKSKLVNFLMKKIGVLPTIILTKIISLIIIVGLYIVYYLKYTSPTVVIIAYFIALALALFKFYQYNFKSDGLGKS